MILHFDYIIYFKALKRVKSVPSVCVRGLRGSFFGGANAQGRFGLLWCDVTLLLGWAKFCATGCSISGRAIWDGSLILFSVPTKFGWYWVLLGLSGFESEGSQICGCICSELLNSGTVPTHLQNGISADSLFKKAGISKERWSLSKKIILLWWDYSLQIFNFLIPGRLICLAMLNVRTRFWHHCLLNTQLC